MNKSMRDVILGAAIAAASVGLVHAAAGKEAKGQRVVSDQAAGTDLKFPESAAYDPKNKVLYVGQFGSKLAPAEKDGQGKIAKVSLDGKVLEDRFLPAAGETMHKPKGIWVKGDRLWVTDIDAVWIFDTKTRKGRKLELSGMGFANDPTVVGNDLYISDNRNDLLYRVEPADFLNAKGTPQVTVALAGRGLNPNGVYPGRGGSVLLGGFLAADKPRGIYELTKKGELKTLADNVGRVDGLYQLKDGSLLLTDWNTGSLAHWSAKGGMQPLAKGFKGPADFTVVPEAKGLLVVVPDLAKSELRFIRLAQ
jgi:hypothetical protein